jgi:CRISPR/Cas system-associated endonuclease Cas1
MDRSRKATREGNEVTLQHKSRKEALLIEELVEEKLAQLQASIEQLKQTPEGIAELQRRIKAFNECKRIEGESSGQYYHKLRHWLDREIPQTKSPLHPPRQVDD